MGKTTIRDVASHAGVSIATVSHVLNDTRFVREETRLKVEESIKKLNYSPDAMARILKTGRKNLIGFIVPDIANSYFATIIEEVESVLAQKKFKLIVSNTKETSKREEDNILTLTSGIVDGLIIASTMEDYRKIEHVIPDGFPIVFIDRNLQNCPYNTIRIDTYSAICQGMELLIKQGHKKFGYITGLTRLSTTTERLSAFKDSLNKHNIPIADNCICVGDSMSESAVPYVDYLISNGCTALVISNNVMTDDVVMYLDSKKIPIGNPNGIEILGFDDSWKIGHRLQRIHLVVQPVVELGNMAGKQIIKCIKSHDFQAKDSILKATFHDRNPG